jgi:glycosyltransferase involved in cell wall biosynthesis
MRIAYDGTPLLGPRTGVGWYTADLVAAVSRQSPHDDVMVLPISWRTARALEPPAPGVRVVRRFAPARPLWALWDRVPWPPVEWLVGCDVFHATNYVAPPSRRVPVVVTVHDIGFVRFPGTTGAAIRRMAQLLPGVLDRAAAIVAVSHFTRDELASWLPRLADRIAVVPNASHPRPERREGAGTGLPPGPPHCLVLGTMEPRKNLPLVLDAFALARRRGLELRLVLAGGASPLLDVPSLLRDRGLGPPDVVTTGYVDDSTAGALLRSARLLAFPSLYEGFGMPVLEAMEAGVPVVAARAGATPEIVGGAGVLVEPHDVEGFAGAMSAVASDEQLRAGLVAAGRKRASAFSWDRAAAACLDLYRRLAG